MFKSDPKPHNVTLYESPHGSHGPKQGNPCSKFKTKSHLLPDKTAQLLKDPTPPPKLPSISLSSKPDSKSPNITLSESPHRSHSPKQINPYPNSKTNSHPSLDDMTNSEKDPPNPPPPPLTFPMSKSDPKPPNITPSKIPYGSHVPKQGNPCPNSKTKSQPLH